MKNMCAFRRSDTPKNTFFFDVQKHSSIKGILSNKHKIPQIEVVTVLL